MYITSCTLQIDHMQITCRSHDILTMRSVALLEGAQANIRQLPSLSLYTCNIASTNVTVFPVPGGPNTT